MTTGTITNKRIIVPMLSLIARTMRLLKKPPPAESSILGFVKKQQIHYIN